MLWSRRALTPYSRKTHLAARRWGSGCPPSNFSHSRKRGTGPGDSSVGRGKQMSEQQEGGSLFSQLSLLVTTTYICVLGRKSKVRGQQVLAHSFKAPRRRDATVVNCMMSTDRRSGVGPEVWCNHHRSPYTHSQDSCIIRVTKERGGISICTPQS